MTIRKIPFLFLVAFLLSVPNLLRAQTDVNLDAEFGGRVSLALDKKITKGLHVAIEEEIRMDNNFSSFNRLHTTLSLSYKVNSNLKIGMGYAMINPYSTSNGVFNSSRHRFMLDATGSLRLGMWRLSLKERFQATYRSGEMNEYQNPRTALTLKSRLKLQYKSQRVAEPYLAVELRNTLNAPVVSALYNGSSYMTESYSTTGEPGWFLDGFYNCYVNRLRGVIGAEVRLNRNNSFDICLMGDYVMDYVVDANAEGTKLKSYTQEKGFVGWLSVGYKYSF